MEEKTVKSLILIRTIVGFNQNGAFGMSRYPRHLAGTVGSQIAIPSIIGCFLGLSMRSRSSARRNEHPPVPGTIKITEQKEKGI
jgi:hypothetical protein